MARKAQDVTEAELAILEKIWSDGPISVKELAVNLYGEATTSTTATVQKLLGRLETKGCVDRDPTVWPRLFRAAIDRDELIHRRLQITADELCEGSLGPLLSHLIKRSGLSRTERTKLRSMLDNLDNES
ncbi:BlaI/MecI/CopY family transcriptional regulator [Rubripirellula amarantea]|uniref:Penicillinase repressor n=1 Tax=Rubripirellula amarantea TaxID=2527999 RepID=A0A5C5WS27_9BACT|nr:BlaI/MecI/CopY family transcriptional regulator [Rubripirellula amarantea]MDA8744945.1 BlaI/MecI/CopY family transcriptional regulator [Rubripirellula amarantea]TWT53397.1 Penicillinase repressor [Rubripirellula amarantea]